MQPTASGERIDLLDAIRGMALTGILLANLMSFFGADMVDATTRRAMPAGAVGEAVLFGINWLIEGKFYSVFSMLFGVGFAMQMQRAERHGQQERFAAFFRRRMTVLVAIGLLHMYALWMGDILTLYGVMGLLLPALMRLAGPARIGVMVALFCVPVATHVAIVISGGQLDPRPPFAAAGTHVAASLGIAGRSTLDVFASDSAADYWSWNVSSAVVRPGSYLQSGRPAKVLALFLLGAWIGSSVLPRLPRVRDRLRRVMVIGGASGLVASYVYASIKMTSGAALAPSAAGLTQTVAYTLGTTPLALAYLCAAALLWDHNRARAAMTWFVPLGRMALSAYLSQTLIQLALFSGLGLGLAGIVPFAWLPILATIIVVVQRHFCRWWLQRYQQGPVEYAWRRASYGASS